MDRRWMLPLVCGLIILLVALANMPTAAATVRWEGQTDMTMLHQVQEDLDQAAKNNIGILKVSLSSPGGPVLTSLAIAKLVRDTEEKTGLIIEIHASIMCASGCTFVLASGSPGHRYIDKEILFLVHPMQSDGGCVVHVPLPLTQEDKATDVLFDLMRTAYIRYTGHSLKDVTEWTTCGKELVGKGDLALVLNMADKLE